MLGMMAWVDLGKKRWEWSECSGMSQCCQGSVVGSLGRSPGVLKEWCELDFVETKRGVNAEFLRP